MGCGTSTMNPWAGRNEVTQSAKDRKNAAREILSANRAYGGAFASYLDTFRVVGSNLGAFMEEEDKALMMGPHPGQPGYQQNNPLSLEYNKQNGMDSQAGPGGAGGAGPQGGGGPAGFGSPATPGGGSQQEPVLQQVTPDGAPKRAQQPPPGPQFGMPQEGAPQEGEDATPRQNGQGGWSADGTTFKYAGSDAFSNGMASPRSSQGTATPRAPMNPPQLPLGSQRGAGLGQAWRLINGLFAEAVDAARPIRDQLHCGLARNPNALPPLPPSLNPQNPAVGAQLGPPGGNLWEAVELLVAYERFRSKETKVLEEAKWDYNKSHKKLASHTSKKVSQEQAAKQQQRINTEHQRAQGHQGRISVLAQNVEGMTRSVEAIKNQLILPLLLQLLPAFVHVSLRLAAIHDRQRQLIQDIFKNGPLSIKTVRGSAVLFTTASHRHTTTALESAINKWDQAFSNQHMAQKRLLANILLWVKTCNPQANIGIPHPPQGAPVPLPTITGGGAANEPPAANVDDPAAGNTDTNPQAADPAMANDTSASPAMGGNTSGTPSNQIIPAQTENQEGAGMMIPHTAPQELMGQYFEGEPPARGEPIVALCQDWLRASDKLPEMAVKDAMLAFVHWLQEVKRKQAAELTQLKQLEASRREERAAAQKYEVALKKERDFRTSMANPHSGPMSMSLQRALSHHEPMPSTNTPLPMLPEPSTPDSSTSSAIQPYTPPPGIEPPLSPHSMPIDKSDIQRVRSEHSKEVRAFQYAKEVDLAKGLWEGAKHRVQEEISSLEITAYEARIAATTAMERTLPGMFAAVAGYNVVLSQMYGMIQHQHVQSNPAVQQGQQATS